MNIFILILIFATYAQTWNLLAGFTGIVSLGHYGIFGVGAYAYGLLAYYFNLNMLFGFVAGGVSSIILGLVAGIISLRIRGAYFALATLAIAEAVRLIVLNLEFTRGGLGVPIKLPPSFNIGNFIVDFHSKIPYYYIALIMTFITFYLANTLIISRHGFKLSMIKEDEVAAASIGLNVFKVKLLVVILCSFICGIAGAFYAQYLQYIDASTDPGGVLSPAMGFDAILITVSGGLGTICGPIFGSVIRVLLSEVFRVYLKFAYGVDQVIFAALLIVIMIFLSKGVWGSFKEKFLPRLKMFRV
jgi:branched-chain amino acid transport system permease protein